MTFHPILQYFIIGAAGALCVQLITLYDQFGKLEAAKFYQMVRARLFWAVTLGMIFASGIVAWAVHADSNTARVFDVFVAGIAARSIVGGVLAGTTSNSKTVAGVESSDEVSMRTIFT